MDGDGVVTVLRRPSQVNAPGHLDTYKRMVGTRNHPMRDGRRVFLSAGVEPGTPAPWDPTVELRPHSEYFIGNIGDAVELVDVPGLGKVPEFTATIRDALAIKDIRNGAVEVSAGYVSWFIPAEEVPVDGVEVVGVGEYRNPATGQIERFDLEGLCDPTDPRIPDEMREFVGGNHLAFCLQRGGGRGGPEVRMLLDSAGSLIDAVPIRRNVRAWQLQRHIDESGVSGPGAVVMLLEVENGPCAAVWLTETSSATAYDSLETFKRIHSGNRSEGANELLPLVIGQAFMPPSTENEPDDDAPDSDSAEENTSMDPNKPGNGTPPNQQPPQDGQKPTGDAAPPNGAPSGTPDYKAMLEKLQQEHAAALEKIKALEGELSAAKTDKAGAQAKADALLEELRPHRERALVVLRDSAADILGATGELAEQISKATADQIPELTVRSYYSAHPEAAALVDNLEGKLKSPEYVSARFDVLREQHSKARRSPAPAVVSDAFAASFKPTTTDSDKNTAKLGGQAALDAMQKEGI